MAPLSLLQATCRVRPWIQDLPGANVITNCVTTNLAMY